MSLLEQVNSLITNVLTHDLALHLSDQFGLDSDQVSRAIKEYLNHVSTPVKNKQGVENKPIKTTPTVETNKTNVCAYIITRGAKEGQACGVNIRGAGKYCSKHNK